MNCKLALVALEGATFSFDKLYTYILPPDLLANAKEGCRVLVPFGRGNTKRQGMIFGISDGDGKGLKSVFSLIDREPVLSGEALSVCEFLCERTFCTYYDAIHALLPAGLTHRLVNYYSANKEFADVSLLSDSEKDIYLYLSNNTEKSDSDIVKIFGVLPELLQKMAEKGAVLKNLDTKQKIKDATQKWVRVSDDFDPDQKLTPRQKEVMDLVGEVGSAAVKEICYFTGVTTSVVEGLIRKGILISFEKEVYRSVKTVSKPQNTEIILTDEQQTAFEGLLSEFKSEAPKTALLYGITGSGKTQVFLKLVDEAVRENKGVIVMVPEISLTPQLLGIFSSRYGDKIAVFHSAMSLGKRMDEWKRIKEGKALIALGTRSAVFAPMENLGLVIMDEEQEHTYKSEQSPRFHARDVAAFRIKRSGGLLVLASATPSLESFTKAKKGKISLYTLKNRYGNAVLPKVETVDTRAELKDGNRGIISRRLYENLYETFEKGEQAILLLNRRGHDTYISCPQCGNVAVCPNCSISLTYHSANNRLMCHYCGYSEAVTKKCSECGGDHIKFSGFGTQKAEEELKTLFPKARILRLDADSTIARDSYANYLKRFGEGDYDIMLGTQMVAKGLDFPNVTLVGVLSADNAMYSEDFKSFERTFSLLTQVIGRAGRGESAGSAIIQTSDPENDIIELAKAQDYDSFYESEILNRKMMIYPPYCDICVVSTRSVSRENAEKSINLIFAEIKKEIENNSRVKVIILGPSPASIPRVNNRYRYRMIIKCKNNKDFRNMLKKAISVKLPADSTVAVDFNPENII
ncbi:MAG: primosomal protein N' [Clostridia bacterium]|nr:primosomal protein N' [Clostridia bacterium]